MVEILTPARHADMALLLKQCFGVSADYPAVYFDKLLPHGVNLAWIEDNRAVSSITLFPGTFEEGARRIPVCYIFAVCTHPDYRGRRLPSRLMDAARTYALENGFDALCLVPAKPSLFGFYDTMGYEHAFWLKECSLSRRDEKNLPKASACFSPATNGQALHRLFRRVHADNLSFYWNVPLCTFLLEDTAFSHGGILGFEDNETAALLVCYRMEDGTVLVKDFSVPENLQPSAFASLFSFFPADRYILLADTGQAMPFVPHKTIPYGGLRPVTPKGDVLAQLCREAARSPFFSPMLD